MKYLFFLVSLIFSFQVVGQTLIEFVNPSFEGIPQAGSQYSSNLLDHWSNCNDIVNKQRSTFDVQPGFFKIKYKPKDGHSFVGLVTKNDRSVECICQELKQDIIRDSLYTFTIYLSRSNDYWSLDINDRGSEHNFDHPTRLRIWGSSFRKTKYELLYETKPIKHNLWREYSISIKPSKNYSHLIFEAYYPDENEFTRGNLLLDAINLEHTSITDSIAYHTARIKDSFSLATSPAYQLIDIATTNNSYCTTAMPLTKVIRNLNSIKKNEVDHSTFIKNLSKPNFNNLLLSLSIVEARKFHDLFLKLRAIVNKDASKTEEEEEFLSSFSTQYADIKKEQTLDIYMMKYVRKYKKEIVDELFGCRYPKG